MSSPEPASTSKSEFRAGGKPLFAALVGTAFGGSPLPFNVLPLVIGPMHAEFGWSFGAISAGIAAFGVMGALLAPLYGAMCDRVGVRKVALWSLAALGVVMASFWAMPGHLAAFYTLCFFLGLVVIGSTPVTWSRGVSLWFVRRRGAALGLMLLGTSICGLTVPHLSRFIIAEAGWRWAFPAAAALALFVALPIAYAWFREPKPEDRPPVPLDEQGRPSGMTLAQAARGYRFWVLFGSIFMVSIAYGGAYIHIGQIVGLHGFSPLKAASALSVWALGVMFGRAFIGFLFDYLWAPLVALPTLLLAGVASVMLMGVGADYSTILIAAALLGLSSGAETDLIAYLTGRYFGMANFGRIYGCLYLSFGFGSASSPLIYGAIRDQTGNYDAALAGAAVLYVVGGLIMLTLGRYPRVDRPAVAEAAPSFTDTPSGAR